jgi:hypothetical protein
MVAQVFDVGEQGISHVQGGNEFDSALAAAIFLEKKLAPPASIVAVVVMIAATIPFRPATGYDSQGNVTDGYMGILAERLRATELRSEDSTYQPDWQDINDIKKEEIPELRKGVTNIQELVRAAEIERSAPFLYQGLGGGNAPIPPDNVLHIYIARDRDGNLLGVERAYPPMAVYHAAVENIKRNARLSRYFFKAHETGVVLIASIATLIDEPQAPVPGIVRSMLWHDTAIPKGKRFEQLSEDEMVIYNELMYGKSQRDVDDATPRRSPVSGLIYGAAGNNGVHELSEYISAIRTAAKERGIEDPFTDREFAVRYTAKVRDVIGAENFKTIMTELHRVARYYQDHSTKGNPNRAARLEELCPGLSEYEGK